MRRAHLLLGSFIVALGCHSAPDESTEGKRGAQEGEPHETHRIVAGDHRHVLRMHVDDRVSLPADPSFDWRVDFEDRSAFAKVAGDDAGGEAYRLLKTGPFRMMVFGEPKCLKADAPCGLSKRRWDVTVDVR